MNEELQTLNAELSTRVEELSRANSDVQNLLESTQIVTVFLDRSLCVKKFTPAAKELWKFCNSFPVEMAAAMIREQPPPDWWERGAPRAR